VHDLPVAPMSNGMVDGYPHQVWWNADGETIVESYTITDMAHGTPLGVAENDERYGAEGAFLIETGISSSHHIASFFGLTEQISRPRAEETPKPAAKPIPQPAPASPRTAGIATVLEPLATLRHVPQPPQPQRRAIDVGAVITRALTAAGLMK
jgi:hypothetical protein